VKRQAAVFVTVPADELLGSFRLRHQPRAVARGLPPHVTVIPPFVRDVAADDALLAALAAHFATVPSFDAALSRVGTFARHVWLAPEPGEAFVQLLEGARERFAELVRDDDRRPAPHLTIAEAGKGTSVGALAEQAEQELAPGLPFAFEVREVGLWDVQPEGWRELQRIPLG
jgi:2'-5' RNA ligase